MVGEVLGTIERGACSMMKSADGGWKMDGWKDVGYVVGLGVRHVLGENSLRS
jgi:hypothetical protein